ncbi:MAG: Ldh family oxidoreductase [Candidatus Poribacteria bacterium]|nr:Ldh family oxidoreductase [Candidatus Poribacteria bacterium]
MPNLSRDQLHDLMTRLFEALGAPKDEAQTTADVLTQANMTGHDSHGLIRMPQYAEAVRKGFIQPGAPTEIVQDADGAAVYNGNWNFGQVSMTHALNETLERAEKGAPVSFGIRNCNHIGRLGHYAHLAAKRGCFALIVVNSTGSASAVAPYGGSEPRLGTNPFCAAFPTESDPVLIDMTSSVAAEGKIRARRNANQPLPEGWILDLEGKPSTDPADFYGPPRGAILSFGGQAAHKGFGLGLFAELLAGTLTGAGNVREREGHVGNGVFCLLIKIDAFRPLGEFQSGVSRLARFLKATRLAEGFDEILLPGEPEARAEKERSANGVWIDETTWGQVMAEAERYGCAPPF